MVGSRGDDIMLGLGGFDKFYGRLGFDWASWEHETHGVSVDMERREFIPANRRRPGTPCATSLSRPKLPAAPHSMTSSEVPDVAQGRYLQ